jgi:hypothetical protein
MKEAFEHRFGPDTWDSKQYATERETFEWAWSEAVDTCALLLRMRNELKLAEQVLEMVR